MTPAASGSHGFSPEVTLSRASPRPVVGGVEFDETVLKEDRYIQWERKVPKRPDGPTGYV